MSTKIKTIIKALRFEIIAGLAYWAITTTAFYFSSGTQDMTQLVRFWVGLGVGFIPGLATFILLTMRPDQ